MELELPNAAVNETCASQTPPEIELPTPTPLHPVTGPWDWSLGGSNFKSSEFDADGCGWTVPLNEEMKELDFWRITFPQDAVYFTLNETNKYANRIIANANKQTKRSGKYKDITKDEFLRYLTIRIIMGMDSKPEFVHYWSRDPIFRSSIVPQILASDRFFEIQRYLHFSDSETQTPGDKLHKIRLIWGKIMHNFQRLLASSKLNIMSHFTLH